MKEHFKGLILPLCLGEIPAGSTELKILASYLETCEQLNMEKIIPFLATTAPTLWTRIAGLQCKYYCWPQDFPESFKKPTLGFAWQRMCLYVVSLLILPKMESLL